VNGANIRIEGRPPMPDLDQKEVRRSVVSPGYFSTLGIRLLGGRAFTDQDRGDTVNLVVIKETMKKLHFLDEDPVGRRMQWGCVAPTCPWMTVIGVVGDIKQDARHFNGTIRATYLPFTTLSLDATFGVDYTGQRSTSFLPFGNNIDQRTNQANEGDKSVDSRVHQEITVGLSGNWTQDITTSFNSSLLFGAQGFLTRNDDESSNNSNFPGPGIEVVNGGSNPQVFEVFSRIVNAT
jgi:hypothetical protein